MSNALASDLVRESGARDTTIGAVETTVAVVKEVGEMLQHIPYVKSVAGIILRIILIRDVSSLSLLSVMP